MKLWSPVLTNIYLHGGSLFDSHHKRGSTTWNSILKAFKHLEDGFSFKVGDGQTSFWFTLWLCEEPLYALVPFVDIHDPGLLICDVWANRTWQLNTLYTQLPDNVVNMLQLVVPRVVAGLANLWVRGECSSGNYTVSTTYHMLIEGEITTQNTHHSWVGYGSSSSPLISSFSYGSFATMLSPLGRSCMLAGLSPWIRVLGVTMSLKCYSVASSHALGSRLFGSHWALLIMPVPIRWTWVCCCAGCKTQFTLTLL